jgi:hypothetical protein
MSGHKPRPISPREKRVRVSRIRRLAERFSFVGIIEYRHRETDSGGAQYGIGRQAELDKLIVYARAFERDADPNDFSLAAMIAHECGHQLLQRDRKLSWLFGALLTAGPVEEVLASILGSRLVFNPKDQRRLFSKAASEPVRCGMPAPSAYRMVRTLTTSLEILL